MITMIKSLSLAKSVLSSAYDMFLNISLAFVKSFRYMLNKSGPRRDSCGTPVLTGRRLDLMLFICTNCYLSDK